MSVQFGKCNFDGKPVDPDDLEEVRPVLAPYGPDGEGFICKDNFAILYRSCHTTKESRREQQPYISLSWAAITWDGRLDNREELIGQMASELSRECTDVEIVAASYERWGTTALGKLIGDWALSVWNPKDESLILAKDFVGTRHLYYSVEKDRAAWCTILDPLVLFAGHAFQLEEEYIAGWLAFFPAAHLTPYVGIHSVPPSSFVRLAREQQRVSRYWDFDPKNNIRYRTDTEYEEHFRIVFSDSVRRRLRSDQAVLSELSGGMDSSSVVCVADEIIGRGLAETPRLDTLSYYDNSEPNWKELPYITAVEQKLARTGCHIDVSARAYAPSSTEYNFAAVPGAAGSKDESAREFATCLIGQGNRTLLSGLGGDEVVGGVPTPNPELQDLIVSLRFRRLAHQLKAWALIQRRPWFYLLWEATQEFAPSVLRSTNQVKTPVSWLCKDFGKKFRLALIGYEPRLRFFGARPSFQQNLATIDAVRRQLACAALSSNPPYEKRYPYLDRDLLEFVCAISREQVVRPGQRRSLQRRALRGIVPTEILDRRRKAYIVRGPMAGISAECKELNVRGMLAASLGIVDPDLFSRALQLVCEGKEVPIVALMRTLTIEAWLRGIENRVQSKGRRLTDQSSLQSEILSPTAILQSSASASRVRQ